jgi:hypothetical protein
MCSYLIAPCLLWNNEPLRLNKVSRSSNQQANSARMTRPGVLLRAKSRHGAPRMRIGSAVHEG